ncbi:MAG TPA: hypothetical protein VJT31_01705 [Rugosimonospora sp.]|nr:hypothetical protein [Rugosimonospora sp.]
MANHRTDDPDNKPTGPSYPGLQVDLNGIDDFVATLRKEVEGNLLPQIDRLLRAYEGGVCFGLVSYSENMAATQQVYHKCLVRISSLLGGYVAAGQVLAAAAEQIANEYRNADAMAAATTQSTAAAISDRVQASQDLFEPPAPHWDKRHREQL